MRLLTLSSSLHLGTISALAALLVLLPGCGAPVAGSSFVASDDGTSFDGGSGGMDDGAQGSVDDEEPMEVEDSPLDWSDLEEPQLTEEAQLIEEHPCFESVTETYVDSSEELVFTFACDPENVDLAVGDILVGQANGGYLREVTSLEVSGYTVIAQTEAATLGQLFETGGFFGEFPIESAARATVDFSGTTLYSGNHGGANVTVKLSKGNISLSPTLILGAQFEWFCVKRAEAILDLQMDAEVELLAQLSDSVSFDGNKTLGTFSYPFVIPAGPVTIPASLDITFTAGFKTSAQATASARVGVESDSSLRVGGHFNSGTWSYTNSKSLSMDRTGPEFDVEGDWSGKVWVAAKARVMMFRAAGPSFHVDPFLSGSAHAECRDLDWEFRAGVDTGVGFDLDLYCYDVSKNFGPWTWDAPIGSGTLELPYPIGTDCDEESPEDGEIDPPGSGGGGGSAPDDGGDGGSAAGDDGSAASGDDDDAPEEPAACYSAGTISCGQTVSGNTATSLAASVAIDSYPINVGNYAAPEIAYTWQATTSSEVEFSFVDPRPTELNHDIIILDGSSGECVNTNAVEWGLNDVRFEPTAGTTYYVVVDGYFGDAGAFELELDCQP